MDKQKTEWPDEARIDTIGQNGNDGEHYAAVSQECEKLRQERDEYRDHLIQICTALEQTPNGKPDISAAWEAVAALAAHQESLVRELTACQFVLHTLARDGHVTPAYADDAKAVLNRCPATSLAEIKAQAIEGFAKHIADEYLAYGSAGIYNSANVASHVTYRCDEYTDRIRKEAL